MNGRRNHGRPFQYVGIGTAANDRVSGSMNSGRLATECGFGLANSKKVSGCIQSHHHRSYSRSYWRSSRSRSGSDYHLTYSDRHLDCHEYGRSDAFLETNDATDRSDENLRLNASKSGESSLAALSGKKNENS